jgi:uncharacterized membrane protein YjdF
MPLIISPLAAAAFTVFFILDIAAFHKLFEWAIHHPADRRPSQAH